MFDDISTVEWTVLVSIAIVGHVMALFWHIAAKRKWKIAEKTIYHLEIPTEQLRRELLNSIHAPIHAVMLALALWLGAFQASGLPSFLIAAAATTLWAEVWHYTSHRAFHLRFLHWIHCEHHKSHLNTCLTALSFSFNEKFIFDLAIIVPLALIDRVCAINFYGIACWYVGYLIINSFSHANFELKSSSYLRGLGKILTSTTYHSLHHARYVGNYGLGCRILDKLFGTEWSDYDEVYTAVAQKRQPLSKLSDRL